MAGGGLALGIFLLVSVCPPEQRTQPQPGRFLGTVWPGRQPSSPNTFDDFVQTMPRIPNDQPLYAYLHPEAPGHQGATVKKPRQRRPSRPGASKKSSQANK